MEIATRLGPNHLTRDFQRDPAASGIRDAQRSSPARLTIVFLIVMFLFVPVGQAVGIEMAERRPRPAYAVNVGASLVGPVDGRSLPAGYQLDTQVGFHQYAYDLCPEFLEGVPAETPDLHVLARIYDQPYEFIEPGGDVLYLRSRSIPTVDRQFLALIGVVVLLI